MHKYILKWFENTVQYREPVEFLLSPVEVVCVVLSRLYTTSFSYGSHDGELGSISFGFLFCGLSHQIQRNKVTSHQGRGLWDIVVV